MDKNLERAILDLLNEDNKHITGDELVLANEKNLKIDLTERNKIIKKYNIIIKRTKRKKKDT